MSDYQIFMIILKLFSTFFSKFVLVLKMVTNNSGRNVKCYYVRDRIDTENSGHAGFLDQVDRVVLLLEQLSCH